MWKKFVWSCTVIVCLVFVTDELGNVDTESLVPKCSFWEWARTHWIQSPHLPDLSRKFILRQLFALIISITEVAQVHTYKMGTDFCVISIFIEYAWHFIVPFSPHFNGCSLVCCFQPSLFQPSKRSHLRLTFEIRRVLTSNTLESKRGPSTSLS